MIDFTDEQYRELCRTGRVRMEIESIEEKRRAALRRFWAILLACLAVTALLSAAAVAAERGVWVLAILVMGLILGFVFAFLPLAKVGREFKQPVLAALAHQTGLHYDTDGFEPPVYGEARGPLFGRYLSGERFSDLFWGTDEAGRRFAVYEARLTRRSGKSTHVVFTGQIYAFQRGRRAAAGPVLVVPDRGFFNFFRPTGGLERVTFDDQEFENRFEVYAAAPHEALALLGTGLRRQFLAWRQNGRVLAWIGAEDVLIAIPGKDRFEPGSMFRGSSGEERVRLMFDDLRGSLATLRTLRASLDGDL